MPTEKIDGLEYPELSEELLMKLLAEQTAAEITLVGADRNIISEMNRILNRLFWEFSHNEYGYTAEKIADDLSKPVELVKEAIAFPLTLSEVKKVFKDI